MKLRFEIEEEDRWRKDIFPCFAIDIEQVAAWTVKTDGSLAIWLKGIAIPQLLVAKDIGEGNFCFLIAILSQEFLNIDDLEFRTTPKGSLSLSQ